ncbi:PREDICTED: uncharacterized protein LOC105152220 [Acromyrmex echinatior]|uniref:uncharacterized protein LOC105152220 n=1 Tax=Acromyrmex echinatior TaxID=103372 RepID=UPI000580DF8F|nr:PREDICTED: uncharacterized protein LOC105152220 [Acromyrmex echinatior]
MCVIGVSVAPVCVHVCARLYARRADQCRRNRMCAAPVCSFAALPFAPVKDWRMACRTLVAGTRAGAQGVSRSGAQPPIFGYYYTLKRRIPRKGRQMYLGKQLDSNPRRTRNTIERNKTLCLLNRRICYTERMILLSYFLWAHICSDSLREE